MNVFSIYIRNAVPMTLWHSEQVCSTSLIDLKKRGSGRHGMRQTEARTIIETRTSLPDRYRVRVCMFVLQCGQVTKNEVKGRM